MKNIDKANKNNKKKKSIALITTTVFLAVILIAGFLLRNVIMKKRYPIFFEEYITAYSNEYAVPEHIIYAVIHTESGFVKNAKSSAGALGLMQIMPSTFEWLVNLMKEDYVEEDILTPKVNIKCGVFYLSYLYERFENWETALAAYNAGPGRVAGWLADTRFSDDGITLTDIPIKETNNYIKKINKTKDIYIDLYSLRCAVSGAK